MELFSRFRLEHHTEKLLSRRAFIGRMGTYVLIALGFIFCGLLVGMIGYHTLEGMGWLDAFLSAAMILGGMGPVGPLHSDAGKLFAGIYALFSGLFFVIIAGLILTPIIHRVLHRFHFDDKEHIS